MAARNVVRSVEVSDQGRWVLMKSGFAMLGELGGTVVGAVAVKALGSGLGEVKHLYVNEAHRGSGIAIALMQQMETEASQRGLTKLRLNVIATRSSVAEWYLRLDNRETDAFENSPAPSRYFEKDLPAEVFKDELGR